MYKHYKYGYYVSDKGKVKRVRNNKKESTQKKMYSFTKQLHLYSFHVFKTIDHINRDKTDNRVENLRWVNHSENMLNRAKWTRS